MFASDASQYLRLQVFAIDLLMLGITFLYWKTISSFFRNHWYLLLPFAYLAVVSFVTPRPAVSFLKLATIALVFVFIITVYQEGKRSLLLVATAAAASLQGVLAGWQFLAQRVIPSTLLGMSEHLPSIRGDAVVETMSERWLRAYGTFPHPNILGIFLVIGFFCALELYFREYERFQWWWNEHGAGMKRPWQASIVRATAGRLTLILASLITILVGLFVSFSRSAVVALSLSLAVYLAMKIYQNKIRGVVLGSKVVILVLGVFFVGTMVFPGLWQTRVQGSGRLEVKSISERSIGYVLAARMFAEQPLVGSGLGQTTLSNARLDPGRDSVTYQPVHNSFVLFLLELGIVGIGIIIVVLRKHLRGFFRYLWTRATPFSLSIFVVVLTAAMFDHFFVSLHAGWVLLGLSILLVAPEKSKT